MKRGALKFRTIARWAHSSLAVAILGLLSPPNVSLFEYLNKFFNYGIINPFQFTIPHKTRKRSQTSKTRETQSLGGGLPRPEPPSFILGAGRLPCDAEAP